MSIFSSSFFFLQVDSMASSQGGGVHYRTYERDDGHGDGKHPHSEKHISDNLSNSYGVPPSC